MKTNKIITTCVLLIGISYLLPSKAFAVLSPNIKIKDTYIPVVTVTVSPTPTPSPTSLIIKRPTINLQFKVTLKKTNALKEINRRIENLNKLINKIKNINRITDTQKETLVAQINIEITKLTDLQTEVENETDAAKLQELKKSITESYRVYGLFMPKIQIIAHADKIIDIANSMLSKTTDEGLKKIITESIAKAQSAIEIVLKLEPDKYPGNKTELNEAKNMLREVRINLNSVFSSIKGQ